MAINIKDPETDRLMRELAEATGESITVAARVAVEERLARVRKHDTSDDELARRLALIDSIIERGRRLPVLDDRTEDEILGYDENGIPS